jgi:hypothetical protein
MTQSPLKSFIDGFNAKQPSQPHQKRLQEEKSLRDNLDEDKVDEMVDETFPASDPPSTY